MEQEMIKKINDALPSSKFVKEITPVEAWYFEPISKAWIQVTLTNVIFDGGTVLNTARFPDGNLATVQNIGLRFVRPKDATWIEKEYKPFPDPLERFRVKIESKPQRSSSMQLSQKIR